MLKPLAQVISVLFHPLLIVTYMLVLLLLINPYLFGVYSIGDKFSKLLILQVFLSTFFIPGFAVAMLRFTGLVSSLEMKTKQERIGPYVITGMFYIWMFRNFLGNAQVPNAFSAFLLGAAIGLFIAFFINIFSKISAHAVGMGGLLGMVVITLLLFSHDTFLINLGAIGVYEVSMYWVLMLTVLLAGLVGTCRLILQAHEPTDLYGGYLVGFVSQFIALRFMF
ncbi:MULTISPECIES: hypothetical protein [Phaeodactylibacter]|jgi:hypothetical protein|uniref:hypothetical protein n=1 Tax=Phaeodactylibacter TaxID=1564515 RepID=UPI0009DE8C73|nr:MULTISPECIES: hypothetical protein [Phaeodactylibacter]MCI4648260.1 hypothetical protein [Phaeodactylibacter sp.]MCI5091885.1 hypothetical protein [Phaeodactylibacter sp.]MCR9050615.1 hypothetical protein [bacterium]